jgi:hypothetical protein
VGCRSWETRRVLECGDGGAGVSAAALAYEKRVGILRLRNRADSRLVCFAQDDNVALVCAVDKTRNGNGDEMTIALESMAVAMPEVDGHPNRAAFRGVLTVVDAPSQRAPSGSNGRRVVLTKNAAEMAVPSLLGMALDYAPSFDRHDVRCKVGVITSAEVVGHDLEVGGYLYAKDFPEIVQEIAKSGRSADGLRVWDGGSRRPTALGLTAGPSRLSSERSRLKDSLLATVKRIRSLTMTMRGRASGDMASSALQVTPGRAAGASLGMSFEVTDVLIADTRARVWTLLQVTFTGAAILRRDKAAFQETWIGLCR